MSTGGTDPVQERSAWHAMLRDHDVLTHKAAGDGSIADAIETLERRLARADAVNHILREGITFRDQLLQAQYLIVDESSGTPIAVMAPFGGVRRRIRRVVVGVRSRIGAALRRRG